MNTSSSGGFDLDHLLDQELQKSVGGLQGPTPDVAQSAYHVFAIGGQSMSLLASLTAAASTKAAAGLAVAALAVGGASVAATAATGSANPTVWGKTVTAAVATCKDKLTDGQHGIGQCVSAVAKQKGAEERAKHPQAGDTHPSGKPTDLPGGKPTDLPGGKPSSLPGGPPSGVPAGPPSSVPPASNGGHPTGPPVSPPSHR
jgi:hypothetical protein